MLKASLHNAIDDASIASCWDALYKGQALWCSVLGNKFCSFYFLL